MIISNMDQVLSDGNILHDEIGLSYSRVKWKYTQQKIAGGAGGNTAGGWCLASNKCV